jgi:CheY-like chemotaxis protein
VGTVTVHVLVVEDDNDFYEDVAAVLGDYGQNVSVTRVSTRDAALAALNDAFFDLVVLDLRIPPTAESLDTDPLHGRAVFGAIRTTAPGTPVVVLTGSPAEEFIPDMLRQAQSVDIWSTGEKAGTVDFLRKVDFERFPASIAPVIDAVMSLSGVELSVTGMNLSIEEDRLLRIFARKFGGVRCAASLISGGLSDARVMRAVVTDARGARVHDAVAKLGALVAVRDESARFDTFIGRLEPHVTPRRIATMEYGAKASGGVFYGLAQGFEFSAFDVAFDSSADPAATLAGVEGGLARWLDGVPETRRSISAIRQRVLSDQDAATVAKNFDLEWLAGFEQQQIQVRWAATHGDLHGANVLVARDGSSVLIDYGDVGEGPASLDPVTMELSLLFHPQRRETGWPTASQAENWGDLAVYAKGCPYPDFLTGCRTWARRVAAGQREVAVSAYAYLLRQLKYEDTDKMLALSLLSGVRNYFGQT